MQHVQAPLAQSFRMYHRMFHSKHDNYEKDHKNNIDNHVWIYVQCGSPGTNYAAVADLDAGSANEYVSESCLHGRNLEQYTG